MNAHELEGTLRAELDRLAIPAAPVVVPTEWDVGPVVAYLFTGEPVTLVDAGPDGEEGRICLARVLEAHGLRPSDVGRIIVTHAHTDHFGGAAWLQERSGCEVLLHPADIDVITRDWADGVRELFLPLGFTEDGLARWLEGGGRWRTPEFTPLEERVYEAGPRRLRVEHHPGHMPGHVWVVDEGSDAIFVGDYLLRSSATTAGLEVDPQDPRGRAPLLERYTEGLRELAARAAPVLFPGHGPPMSDYAPLIERRLQKSERRTRRVLRALRERGPCTAVELALHTYGERATASWGTVADVVGRLDVLVGTGHASCRMGEDGHWVFEARIDDEGGSDA